MDDGDHNTSVVMVAIIHRLLWSPSSISCYGRHHPSVVMVAIIHQLLWSTFSIGCYGRHHPSVVMEQSMDDGDHKVPEEVTYD
jgi:hypothetical protein